MSQSNGMENKLALKNVNRVMRECRIDMLKRIIYDKLKFPKER